VPVYFVYEKDSLYSFSTVGQKIEWMRANPLVCVEVDEVVNPQQWVSVVVFGRYEELLDAPEWQGAREVAATDRHVVGARVRENGPLPETAPAGAGLLPHSRRSDYRPPRYPRANGAS
jgi:nitroimidazol reductase NimA-like FMN-containing flavoprotein (pyridoxamine 5'-phosphate oxidase superfamily)